MRPGRPEGAQEEQLRRQHGAAPPVRCKAPAPARILFWGYNRSERQHPGSQPRTVGQQEVATVCSACSCPPDSICITVC